MPDNKLAYLSVLNGLSQGILEGLKMRQERALEEKKMGLMEKQAGYQEQQAQALASESPAKIKLYESQAAQNIAEADYKSALANYLGKIKPSIEKGKLAIAGGEKEKDIQNQFNLSIKELRQVEDDLLPLIENDAALQFKLNDPSRARFKDKIQAQYNANKKNLNIKMTAYGNAYQQVSALGEKLGTKPQESSEIKQYLIDNGYLNEPGQGAAQPTETVGVPVQKASTKTPAEMVMPKGPLNLAPPIDPIEQPLRQIGNATDMESLTKLGNSLMTSAIYKDPSKRSQLQKALLDKRAELIGGANK